MRRGCEEVKSVGGGDCEEVKSVGGGDCEEVICENV